MIYMKKIPKYLACYIAVFLCVFVYLNINIPEQIPAEIKIPAPSIAEPPENTEVTVPDIPDPPEKTRRFIDRDDPEEPESVVYLKKKHLREITIAATGDLTLASNFSKSYSGSFYELYDLYGPEYFMENVAHIFHESDYTVANLECALTDNKSTRRSDLYAYRGYASYTDILTVSGIDAVNLANNHTFDYSQAGYDDTTAALREANIGYFGNSDIFIDEINGIKVGFIGILGESRSWQVPDALEYLDAQGVDIKIVTFHWGNMDERVANGGQVAAGHLAIDCGADIVIGHQPHVLQGIEEYKGKYIIYSLGNFIFDGNVISDIENRTSVIIRIKFVLNGTNIIESSYDLFPILVTSNMSRNNFKPILAEGEQKENILRKIEARSVH